MKLNKINADPWLASGVATLAVFIFSALLQLLTSIPFMQRYIILTGLIAYGAGTLAYVNMKNKYDKKKTTINIFMLFFLLKLLSLCFSYSCLQTKHQQIKQKERNHWEAKEANRRRRM